jgi:two-component system cell cycle sensor histidine kinase/response regulator CckA
MSQGKETSQINVSGIDLEWRPEQGTCTFAKLPVAMMWVDTTLAGLMAGVQAMVGTERFALALQSEGRKSVEADWQIIAQYPDFPDGFRAIANIAAVAGWGHWELVQLDREHQKARFTVKDSWEGGYQRAIGVCWGSAMLAGKLAGYCSKLFATNCWAEQIKFIAKGDGQDEFIVRPSLRLVEKEIESLLATDEATRADMEIALRRLSEEIDQRKRKEQELSGAYDQLRAVEEERRARETLLNSVLQSTADGILVIGPLGEVLTANRRFQELWQIPEALMGGGSDKQLLDHVIGQLSDPQAFLAEVQRLYQTEEEAWSALKFKDGRFFERYSRPLKLDTGLGRLWSFRDITERRRAHEALSASQAELSSIFRAAPIGIGMVVDRVIQEANDAFCAMTGYTRNELIGQSAHMLYPTEEDFEYVGREKYQKIAEHGSGTVETHWLTKDGRILDILLSSSPLDACDWSRGVTFTALDITERRRAEEALRRSEDKFAKAFHSGPDALVISRTDDGMVIEVNEGFLALTGYTREEAQGRTTVSLKLWANPQDREGYVAALSKHGRVRDLEHDFRTKSGNILNCMVSAELINLGDERCALSIIRDISERKRAEKERLEMERRLLHSQKLESLGVLAGGIAHDFNNLLMAIIGNLDLALLDLSPVSPSREYLEQAMHASQRASDLTRQMLAYSGKGRFVLEGIDLAELVLENAHLLKASIAKTASLDLVVAPGLSHIQADPGQVQQVIMNLITNASEAIGDSAGLITIATGEQEFDETYLSHSRVEQKPSPGRFVFVEVTDTGCGMNGDTLQRLFEPFFTTKFTGRGLGMSAVLGIVRGHQGAIVVESEAGRGSTIRVLFPITASMGVKKSADVSTAVSPESPSLFSGTALIVDDEDTVRELCEAYIGRLGLKTLAAADGKQALELFRKHAGEIVCVVLDLNMPEMDGVSAFRELRQLQPDIQVILCSGYNEQEATQHFYGEGLAAFIQKPYRLQDLKQKIEQVLRSTKKNQREAGPSS